MDAVLKKLRLLNGGIVLNAPEEVAKELRQAGFVSKLESKGGNENTIVFLADRKAAISFLQKQLKEIKYDGLLWLLYPKAASGIKTDINRTSLWELAAPFGIRPVTNISFSDEWSALRFRPIDAVGK